uniref:Rab-GAP TBC domain-containing protein n=1 Tax=Amphimedon queenslandica TaxID=400682 RepID=A0A1X7VAF8_AMPQE
MSSENEEKTPIVQSVESPPLLEDIKEEGGGREGEHELMSEGSPGGDSSVVASPGSVLEGENHLLKMLEEQNRMLESDSRYHQNINGSPTKPCVGELEQKESGGGKKDKKEKEKKKEKETEKAKDKKEKEPEKMKESKEEKKERKEAERKERKAEKKERKESLRKEKKDYEKKDKKDKKSTESEREKSPGSAAATPVEVTPSITSTEDRHSISDSGSEINSVTSRSNEDERILIVWSDVMKNWEEISRKNFKFIRSLVLRGIPGPMRGMAWQLLAGAQTMTLKTQYPSLITAYSVYDPEVGYCQGSLFIAGILLMNMPEEEAFCVFTHMMSHHKLRELYKPTMADLSVRFYQLENLVEELFPRLDIHFRALGFHTSMYSSSWFLTLFASTLPLCAAFRVLDIFLIDGIEIIFRVGLALLERSQNELLKLDMEDMTKHFQKEMKSLSEEDCDTLFEAAFRVKVSSKKLKKMEKEYNQRKERQQVENSELIRLQDDNCELEKRVLALEKECAGLADRLIQGQVTRAQEYEEMYGVRRELTTLRKKVASFEKKEKSQSNHKSRSNTPEVHPTKYLSPLPSSMDFRDRSTSAPSLRDTPQSASTSSLVSIEEGTKEQSSQVSATAEEETPTPLPETSPADPPPPHSPSLDVETLLRELAIVKIERAECADLLERKALELRKLNKKFSDTEKELKEAHEKIAQLQREKICPKCGSNAESIDGVASSVNSESSKQAVAIATIDDLELQFNELLSNLENVIQTPLEYESKEKEKEEEEEEGEEEQLDNSASVGGSET